MPGGGLGTVTPDSPFPPPNRTIWRPTPAFAQPDPDLMQRDTSQITASKMGKHPCWRARDESALCLEQTNYDRTACIDFFYNVRACHKAVHEARGNWINLGGGGKDEEAPIINVRILLEKLGLRKKATDD